MTNVTIVAPSSPIEITQQEKETILNWFSAHGFQAQFAPHCFEQNRYLAGTDINRAEDINKAFADNQTDVIIALRGGYGSPRILDKLDYKMIRQHKKPFIGFSDLTALQMALYHQVQLPSYTGFNANFILKPMGSEMEKTLLKALRGEPLTVTGLKHIIPGTAYAPVLGGTLTLLCGLLGTSYMPNLTDTILVVEDVHEEPYRIDRMLNQLRLAGSLSQLAGVIIADCSDCTAKDSADGTVIDVFNDYFGNKKIPVVTHFPYGHTQDHIVFPLGCNARLDANKGTLIFDTI
ncbi:MAG: LD-carboxypeptidase [Alphaproteobacteria bacterium]|nr:LD-carboxypeptidase [Alphaproteobacteria bacterium]